MHELQFSVSFWASELQYSILHQLSAPCRLNKWLCCELYESYYVHVCFFLTMYCRSMKGSLTATTLMPFSRQALKTKRPIRPKLERERNLMELWGNGQECFSDASNRLAICIQSPEQIHLPHQKALIIVPFNQELKYSVSVLSSPIDSNTGLRHGCCWLVGIRVTWGKEEKKQILLRKNAVDIIRIQVTQVHTF